MKMEESQKKLQVLEDELASRRNKWRDIHVAWAPSFERRVQAPAGMKFEDTYLSHVMGSAFDLTNSRNSCLFQTALSQMTEKEKPGSKQGFVSRFNMRKSDPALCNSGDKVTVELAALDASTYAISNMADFSRFLFHLAGEYELADAPDPARALERFELRSLPPRAKNDRLIH